MFRFSLIYAGSDSLRNRVVSLRVVFVWFRLVSFSYPFGSVLFSLVLFRDVFVSCRCVSGSHRGVSFSLVPVSF